MTPIRILLADDHALLRAGVRSLLEAFEGVEVVAEAADGAEALRLIELHRPDLALLDISMPKLGGLDVAARVSEVSPSTRVIILSMHVDEQYVQKAIRAGASGYLLKDTGKTELEAAIHAVGGGTNYFSPAVSSHLVTGFQKRDRADPPDADLLTTRQREILRLIAEGQTTKAIARDLALSVKTVEAHRSQLMDRLDIHEIAGLVRYAIRTGLITDI
jgi:DNA-binding NarL/FixJ family response regulator